MKQLQKAFRASIRHATGPNQWTEWLDGLLLVDEIGKIVACGPWEELREKIPRVCKVEDFRPHWIVPGFVDCHVHLPQLDCRNKSGLTLLDWLKHHIYPAEASFSNPKKAAEVAPRFFDELLTHGITTAAVHSTIHYEATDIAFQIAEEKGLRIILGQVLMDQNAPAELLKKPGRLLTESEQLISKWHGKAGRLYCAITPRFALTCSKELLRNAGHLAHEAGVYFQTHLAETTDEVKQAMELHRFKNYPGYYEELNCLGHRSLFAHCIYLNDGEWKILAQHKSTVAHCPTSNVFLKSGTMPLELVEKNGMRCGLGTDVGGGPTFAMRKVMDCAGKVHPKGQMTPAKAFYMATLGGAEALSLSDQIGNFSEGKFADFAIFPQNQIGNKAMQVFVQGECRWRNPDL